MKVNFNKRFRLYDGKESPESIANVVAQALYNHGSAKPVDAKEKYRAYVLSTQIVSQDGEIDITTEDATLIKNVCGEGLTSGGYGQVYEIIEDR